MCCSVMQGVCVRWSVLQYVCVCCNVLQWVGTLKFNSIMGATTIEEIKKRIVQAMRYHIISFYVSSACFILCFHAYIHAYVHISQIHSHASCLHKIKVHKVCGTDKYEHTYQLPYVTHLLSFMFHTYSDLCFHKYEHTHRHLQILTRRKIRKGCGVNK